MIRRYRIGNCHLNVFAGLFSSFGSAFKITRIITGIKNTEYVYTVFGGCFNKFINNIVRIVAVSQKILTAQKHHYVAVGKSCMKFAKAFPRIFVQKADTAVVSSSAPAFYRPITDFIDHRTGRKHIRRSHTGCMKRL